MFKVIQAHVQQIGTMLVAYYLVQLGFGPIAEQVITKLAALCGSCVEFICHRRKFGG